MTYVDRSNDKQATVFMAEAESREVEKVLLEGQALGTDDTNWEKGSWTPALAESQCDWPSEVPGEIPRVTLG